jgi:CopG family nickel-responsive transcriptional regulator
VAERFTISIDAELIEAFDEFIAGKGYANRSEAVRDLIRERLAAERLDATGEAAPAIACLSYVFDHDQRVLAARLVEAQHRHHHLSRATMHVHLDRHECMEVSILEGPVGEVRRFAEDVIAERGVRHGQLHIVPAGEEDAAPPSAPTRPARGHHHPHSAG